MDGSLDEVRISNIARAAEWIKAEYYTQTDDIIEWGEIEKVFKFAKITFSGDGRLSFSGNKVLLFIKG
jgi:hypothetical protein